MMEHENHFNYSLDQYEKLPETIKNNPVVGVFLHDFIEKIKGAGLTDEEKIYFSQNIDKIPHREFVQKLFSNAQNTSVFQKLKEKNIDFNRALEVFNASTDDQIYALVELLRTITTAQNTDLDQILEMIYEQIKATPVQNVEGVKKSNKIRTFIRNHGWKFGLGAVATLVGGLAVAELRDGKSEGKPLSPQERTELYTQNISAHDREAIQSTINPHDLYKFFDLLDGPEQQELVDFPADANFTNGPRSLPDVSTDKFTITDIEITPLDPENTEPFSAENKLKYELSGKIMINNVAHLITIDHNTNAGYVETDNEQNDFNPDCLRVTFARGIDDAVETVGRYVFVVSSADGTITLVSGHSGITGIKGVGLQLDTESDVYNPFTATKHPTHLTQLHTENTNDHLAKIAKEMLPKITQFLRGEH